MPGMDAILIVGTGRCGSTLLSKMLNGHPDVLSLSEFFMSLQPGAFPAGSLTGAEFWDLLSRPRPGPSLLIRHGLQPEEMLYPIDGDGRFSGGVPVPPVCVAALPLLSDDPDALYAELEGAVPGFPAGPVSDHYRRFFDLLADKLGKRVVVERSGGSLSCLAEMRAVLPEARVVHVVRDGQRCALSMREHEAYRIWQIGRMFERKLGVNPYRFEGGYAVEDVPQELQPLLPERFDREAYLSFPIPAHEFGLQWSTLIIHALPVLKAIPPDRLMTVRYEDLTERPRETLAALREFAGLADPHDAWLDAETARVRPARPRSAGEALPADEARRLAKATAIATRYLDRFAARRASAGAAR